MFERVGIIIVFLKNTAPIRNGIIQNGCRRQVKLADGSRFAWVKEITKQCLIISSRIRYRSHSRSRNRRCWCLRRRSRSKREQE